MKRRNEYPRAITPKIEVTWAQLNEPDYKYKEEGEFHVRGRPDTDDPAWDALIATGQKVLDEFFDEQQAELKAQKKGALAAKLHKVDVAKEEIDNETGQPTGYMSLRAGMKYHVTVKNGPKAGKEYFFTPDFFNAQGERLKNPPKIGSGSTLKLGVRVLPYLIAKDGEVGVSFNLEGVQILKLVSGGQRSASDYGFGAEEGDDIRDDNGGFADEGAGFSGDDSGGTDRDF